LPIFPKQGGFLCVQFEINMRKNKAWIIGEVVKGKGEARVV